MADVDAKRLSKAVRGQLPRYPLPVAFIARLAVHGAAHSTSDQIGCIGVIPDAKNERAEGFNLKYGFTLIDGSSFLGVDDAWPHRLFLLMPTTRAGRGPRSRPRFEAGGPNGYKVENLAVTSWNR
jgi:hypothetical protein